MASSRSDSYAAPKFNAVVLTALDDLRKARRALRKIRCHLHATEMSPVAESDLTKRHDAAARAVTTAAFWLNDALDAEDGE